MDMNMNCKICQSPTHYLFKKKILFKYEVSYFRCQDCGFVQTQEPYWLAEAYDEAITAVDVGLVLRNLFFSDFVEKVINTHFNKENCYLDFAGGYGLFVRLMRDRGIDFYRQDAYCQNLFAKYFDIEDLKEVPKFELCTAIEVFEHFADPLVEIEKLLSFSDSIFFSTDVQDSWGGDIESWYYLAAETGQHVSLFTLKSLKVIADALDCYFYTDSKWVHMFTKKNLGKDPFRKSGLYDKAGFKKLELLCSSQWIKLDSSFFEKVTSFNNADGEHIIKQLSKTLKT